MIAKPGRFDSLDTFGNPLGVNGLGDYDPGQFLSTRLDTPLGNFSLLETVMACGLAYIAVKAIAGGIGNKYQDRKARKAKARASEERARRKRSAERTGALKTLFGIG